jgi:hypothetical protein
MPILMRRKAKEVPPALKKGSGMPLPHGGCDNRDVDNSLARYSEVMPMAIRLPIMSGAFHGNLNTAPDEKHEHMITVSAPTSPILGQNREDEVL